MRTPPNLAAARAARTYVVLHDATLREVATRRPTTRDGLAAISGFGATKLERYAEGVLATLAAHTADG